ncbi:unnamed protein product [Clonostachys rosea]|uniref:F-box domain-containing protein n=1 Tax=Bionectria ochroleuca TaxID=29856 RepID=A0ABY6UDS4_BIOOC|nr:unnamed protein product [Clonostachys rosea]
MILYGLLIRLPLYLFIVPIVFIVQVWRRMFPSVQSKRWTRFHKKRDEAFPKHVDRSSFLDLAQLRRDASQPEPKDKFFGCLPPEIRRRILIYAFGERTVHIDISYIPINEPDETDSMGASAANRHAGLVRRRDNYWDKDPEWAMHWQWYGCVCHRSGPEEMTLSLGRFRTSLIRDFKCRLAHIACLNGDGVCHAWPGEQPGKCLVGCLGWLLTSKQAYIEGMEVIYGTNTINLSSPELMLSSMAALPSNIMRSIRSLELAIDAQGSPLKHSFPNPRISAPDLPVVPIFPSLLYLRIALTDWDLDISINNRPGHSRPNGPTPEQWRQSIPTHASTMLHRIDSLLEKIAPPAAEAMVDWDLTSYRTLSHVLIELQGRESLQMQECESGERRYWRQISASIANSDPGHANAVEIEHGIEKRQGYWIHCDEESDSEEW